METTQNVRDVALNRAIKILQSLKTEYIIRIDGDTLLTHGNVKLAEEKPRKRSPNKLPTGTLKHHIEKHGLSKLKDGDTCCIPLGDIGTDLDTIRSAACARAHALWGKQSVITKIDRDNNHVEIFRVQ